MVDPLSYFSFQSVMHDWAILCGMVHVKHLLLIGERVAHDVAAGFLSLSDCSFTLCPSPYNRKVNVLYASLIKHFPSSDQS